MSEIIEIFILPQASGAKCPSGFTPGARVSITARLFTREEISSIERNWHAFYVNLASKLAAESSFQSKSNI